MAGLALMILLIGQVCSKDLVVKGGFGVVFKKTPLTIFNTNSRVLYTFAIPLIKGLPNLKMLPVDCSYYDGDNGIPDSVIAAELHQCHQCHQLNAILHGFIVQQDIFSSQLDAVIKLIDSILRPSVGNGKASQFPRKRRGLFDGVGKFLNYAISIGLDDDVQILMAHVSSIENFLNCSKKHTVDNSHKLNAYIQLNNVRISNLYNIIHSHASALNATLTCLADMQRRMSSVASMTSWLINGMQRLSLSVGKLMALSWSNLNILNTVVDDSRNWIEGAQKLIRGKLPIELVQPVHLKSALTEVSHILRKHHPSFYPAFEHVQTYYKASNILYTI